MLPSELQDLVRTIQRTKAEGQHIEVKAAHDECPRRLYDTLSAFSNQEDGGIIVFGLAEKNAFEIVGVYDAQDLQHKVNAQCKQMQPTVRPLFTVAEIDDHTVVSAEIPEVDIKDKPCYYLGAGRLRGSYIRVGGSDEPMTEFEIYSYEVFRNRYQDDTRVVERSTVASLNEASLTGYTSAAKQGKPNLASVDDKEINELLSVTRNGTPTLAAVMMFSPYPQAYFPQYCVTAAVVPGYQMGELGEEGSRFLDNRRIEGSIPDMLDQALLFVKKNMSVKTIVDESTGRRTDRPEYPIVAVREAVLNALVHRDYSVHTEGTPIQIVFYKDRLEISNPGGLYGRLAVGRIGQVRADTRNPVLANMLEVLRLVENRYSGIPTIRREMKEAGLPPPEFYSERGTFRVVFYNTPSAATAARSNDMSSRLNEILRYCATPRSREEIACFLGVETVDYAIRKYVMPLIDKGLLAMTIPERPRSRSQRFVASSAIL